MEHQPPRQRSRTVASLTLLALTVAVASISITQWDVAWGALPGRIGPPDATIPIDPVPPEGQPIVRLAVLGDVGTGDERQRAVADSATRVGLPDPFDGLVLLGDNAYPDGAPDRLDGTVFQPFAAILEEGAALLPVLGNHDVRHGNAAGQVNGLGMPGRWYATRLGPVLLIGLDSNLVEDHDQLGWLESTLAGNDLPWVIAAMHHPAYSAGFHGSDDDVQETWVPLFERYGVDLVLAGHDHDYQRSIPLGGVTYIVSGAGAKARPTDTADFTAYAASVRHFLDIGIWDDRLEVTAISENGAFDRVVIPAS